MMIDTCRIVKGGHDFHKSEKIIYSSLEYIFNEALKHYERCLLRLLINYVFSSIWNFFI